MYINLVYFISIFLRVFSRTNDDNSYFNVVYKHCYKWSSDKKCTNVVCLFHILRKRSQELRSSILVMMIYS